MTSQMFTCQEKPNIPDGSDAELATYIVRLVLAHDDCTDQLDTIENHLEINGVTITDTLVSEEKPKKKRLGLF